MIKHSARGAVVIAVAVGATALGGGVAFAYWSTTGSGTGTAGATSATAISATAATAAAGLYPGASGVVGTVTVSNPNPFPVKITAASFASPTVDGGHSSCTTTGVTFTSQSLSTPLIVPAKTGTNGTATLNFTAAMDNTSLTTCQGATFTSTVTLTATT